MTKEEYRYLLRDYKNKEAYLSLYDAFSLFIDDERQNISTGGLMNDNRIEQFRSYVSEKKIDVITNSLYNQFKMKTNKKEEIFRVFLASLRQNLMNVVNKKNVPLDFKKMVERCEKAARSYLNVMLIPLIESALSDGMTNKKTILAVGLVELEKDDIRVNEEILNLFSKFDHNTQFQLIPIFGSTVDVFERVIQIFKVQFIHFSGHGCENGTVAFVGSNLKPKTFGKYLSTSLVSQYEGLFINTCFSEIFLKDLDHKFFGSGIGHQGKVGCSTAYDCSDLFYDKLSSSNDFINAYITTIKPEYTLV